MDDKRVLEDGKLVLFRRNGLWQARIPVGSGRYLRHPLPDAPMLFRKSERVTGLD
jgi:hypothetical protein